MLLTPLKGQALRLKKSGLVPRLLSAAVGKGSWGDLFSLCAVELQAFGFLIAFRVLAQFLLLETTWTLQSASIYQNQYPKV